MTKIKIEPVKSLREVRYKVAEKWAEYENGDMSDKQAKTHIGFAMTLVHACKTEVIRQHFNGAIDQIDFLDVSPQPNKIKNVKNIISDGESQ